MKATWGPLAYLCAEPSPCFPDLTDYHTVVESDGGPACRIAAINPSSWQTAAMPPTAGTSPRGANPEDGLLDVVIVHSGPLFDLATVAAQLVGGDYLDSNHVTLRRKRGAFPHTIPT